jgi:hypothetical protein
MKRKVCSDQLFRFSSLRNDWYQSNQTLPRAIRQTVEGTHRFVFHGFPRQWIPLFAWFGARWEKSVEPIEYLPLFSDLNEQQLNRIVRRARAERMLRPMLEAASTLDPVVSDCLYILDHTVKKLSDTMLNDVSIEKLRPRKTLLLTSWQAYGRPSILRLEKEVAKIPVRGNGAVMLPCSFKRPYDTSPTHRRIYAELEQLGYEIKRLHKVVITSLGVIPEELWAAPAVLQYDAGVPDLYRLLRLLRTFFSTRSYPYVLDCSEFPPFSDLLQIVYRDGLINDLRRLAFRSSRAFYVRNPNRRKAKGSPS